MNFLALLVLLSAIAISACGAYFSIVGLKMLFVGGGISIIIMGTALEIGKLITATFLKQKWNEIGWLMKTYMTIATLFLMGITSIGIYGYLSAGYTATNITVQGYEQQIESNNIKISEFEKEINNIKTSEYNSNEITAIEDNRKKFIEQKLQVVSQKNKQIEDIRKLPNTNQDASVDIVAAKQALEISKSSTDNDISRELEQIKLYNDRLEILDKEVQKWIEQGTGGLFKKSGLDQARVVKENQNKDRSEIDSLIKSSQERISKLREQYSAQVKQYNDRVSEIEARSKSQRTDIEANIKKLEKENEESVSAIDVYNKEIDAKIAALNAKKDELAEFGLKKVVEYQGNIQSLRNQNTELKEKIVHTDVGTFKFIANSLKIPLDAAVNYFIWSIMFVFDPLAIALILAYNSLIQSKKQKIENPIKTDIENATQKLEKKTPSDTFNIEKAILTTEAVPESKKNLPVEPIVDLVKEPVDKVPKISQKETSTSTVEESTEQIKFITPNPPASPVVPHGIVSGKNHPHDKI